MSFKVTFLGTGGGRHTTMYQTRCTGGMLMEHDGKMLHIDPGPGALVQMHRIHYDPMQTDSVIISHAHPDHYSDAESVIEGITRGGWTKRGSLFGSTSVLEGGEGFCPCISPYHMSIIENKTVFSPGDTLNVDGMKVDICKAIHSDPANVGFKFHTPHGIFSYVSDTEFTEEIAKQYIGSRVVALPITTPDDSRIKYHMCTEDAISFMNIVKPELTIFIHLGVVMIKKNPKAQAKTAEEATGYKCIAGEDLMTLNLEKEIILDKAQVFDDDWIPDSSP